MAGKPLAMLMAAVVAAGAMAPLAAEAKGNVSRSKIKYGNVKPRSNPDARGISPQAETTPNKQGTATSPIGNRR